MRTRLQCRWQLVASAVDCHIERMPLRGVGALDRCVASIQLISKSGTDSPYRPTPNFGERRASRDEGVT
jgi:hypothetical protein